MDVVAKVKELTGGKDCGVDVAFEAAGNGKALEVAIAATCTRGRVLNVSVWSKPAVVSPVFFRKSENFWKQADRKSSVRSI